MFLLDSSVETFGRDLLLVAITYSTAVTGFFLLLSFSCQLLIHSPAYNPLRSVVNSKA